MLEASKAIIHRSIADRRQVSNTEYFNNDSAPHSPYLRCRHINMGVQDASNYSL
jgi:hypothetical protein